MKALVIEPGKKPEVKEIRDDLASMQNVVGGLIEVLYPWEDPVALVCNDEGKLLGLPLNRALTDEETGQPYDVVAGTFFLCGVPEDSENFASLTEEQIQKYQSAFASPEIILNLGGQLMVIREAES